MFRLMQNLGLDTTGAYPFVRAAILGHAMRKDNRCMDVTKENSIS